MNTEQAKKLNLPELMSRMGYEPERSIKGGYELWYKSPFRTEKDASFHTSYLGGKWIWNDFGDHGGTVIDFIMRHERFTSVREVLTFLDHMYQGHLFEKPKSKRVRAFPQQPTLFSFQQHDREAVENFSTEPTLEFIAATPITGKTLFRYLEKERGIPRQLVTRYLVRILYRNRKDGREYYGFGMENESGGYEVRAASSRYDFKSALIARDLSLVPGTDSALQAVNVFEGMLDFLSLLAMHKIEQLRGDALILHSTSSFSKARSFIQQNRYVTINTFLDNDRTGEETTGRFSHAFPNQVSPQNSLYRGFKDLNQALIERSSL